MLDTPARMKTDAPSLTDEGMPARPNLLSVEDAKAMSVATMTDLFRDHINPGQLHFMKLLGFDKVKIESASGMYYTDQNGRKILDFFGGFGSLAFGTNIWKVMFKTVFDLPDHAWTQLAIRWGGYFVFMAAANEFVWRYFVPPLEEPLYIAGLLWAPAGEYDFLGITFGARNFEDAWATWWKLGTWVITLAFGAANVPYTMKHLRDSDDDAGKSESEASA